MSTEGFCGLDFGGCKTIQLLRLGNHRIELIDRALGGLFQLVGKLLSINGEVFATIGLEGKKAAIARRTDVRFLQEL